MFSGFRLTPGYSSRPSLNAQLRRLGKIGVFHACSKKRDFERNEEAFSSL